jgi:hypothetical protein
VIGKGRGAGTLGLGGALTALAIAKVLAQAPAQPDWKALEPEMIQQFQAVLRFDTRNPPGNEHIVAEYLKGVFDKAAFPRRSSRSTPTAPMSSRG